MTYSNIINGSIEYVPRKTRDDRAVTVAVPLIDAAKELIQKYLDESRGTLFLFISEQKYNVYKSVKDPAIVGAMSGHKDGSRAFARYRDIDMDIKRDAVSALE